MTKVHVVLRKEDIDETALADAKVAVVFDILLATSSITAALAAGARSVIPVYNAAEAEQVGRRLPGGSYELVGESEGRTIAGFHPPAPLFLQTVCPEKTVVLSTTNGTVALRKAMPARAVYAASLLNSPAVSEHIGRSHKEETVIAICAGSSGRFCLEDFYGAGYFVHCLVEQGIAAAELSDSAMAAWLFYRQYASEEKAKEVLSASRVGRWMVAYGLEKEIDYINRHGALSVIPKLEPGPLAAEVRDIVQMKMTKEGNEQ
ncbi:MULTISPECIES: 2-phosphosulfolactate phosphatase [unclassified Geobacillus]|uniref:2-phosphosulfolactate phosphatase n=1 Tax=unclassified Geobacillus TaxID=2642459 RepID=UPI000649CCEA|nr:MULTISPECIES: 2-phosphosulfolactate phosphatase [unclassified Geobacillus]AKM18348.1 putative 2-phosphosulfolactate phosphatase [Geobacillus sp. 12AMOR1]AKU27549.1 2-phosphosulfolactate phosphatase [Geobacillus sp. LC300]KZE96121.1 putative 2-phosphosulfolactate phosphatase [Geobacillus stearothermophilus]KZM52775.1 2-phosphosulfolactate phosphatase [Geobacillus stearothermophilus]NNU97926.1 2-phosphosulfolactate phosphatase [Geobacillus sp. DSP4a]